MALIDTILSLTRQFYPTGRAFKFPAGGVLDKLHIGLGLSEARAYSDAIAILNSILPDNDSFDTSDAADWERRLGLVTNLSVSLANRKAAIKRKINHPGTIKARQHYLYIQGQLQAAGFNVYVFENIFPDGMGGFRTYDPLAVTGGLGSGSYQHGDIQHGDVQHGAGAFKNIIANFVEEDLDNNFNAGVNLRSTFFIGGSYLGTFANVDINRKLEFRQLILKLKPVQTVGYLFINYI